MKIIPSLIACGLMAAPVYAQAAPAPVVGATTQTAQAQSALELLHPELALIPQAGVDAVLCINRIENWEGMIGLALGKVTQEELDAEAKEYEQYGMDKYSPRSMSYAGNAAELEKLEPLFALVNLLFAPEINFPGAVSMGRGSQGDFIRCVEQLFTKYPQPLGESKIAPFYIALQIGAANEIFAIIAERAEDAEKQEFEGYRPFNGVRLNSLLKPQMLLDELSPAETPKTYAFVKDIMRRNPAILARAVGEDKVLIIIAEDLADIPAMPESASASLLASKVVEPLQALAGEKEFIVAANMPVSLLRKAPIVSMGFPGGMAQVIELLPNFLPTLDEQQSKGFEKLTALLQSLATDAEQGNALLSAYINQGALVDIQLDLPCKETPFLAGPKAAPTPPAEGELLRLSMSPRRALQKPLPGLGMTDAPTMLALSKFMFPKQAEPSMDKVLATATMQAFSALTQPTSTHFSVSFLGDILPAHPSFGQETWQGLELELYTALLPQLAELEWQEVSKAVSLEVKKQWNRSSKGDEVRHIEITEEEAPKAPEPTPEAAVPTDPDEGEDYEEDDSYDNIDWSEMSKLYSAYGNLRAYKSLSEDVPCIRFTVQPQEGKHKLRLQFIKK